MYKGWTALYTDRSLAEKKFYSKDYSFYLQNIVVHSVYKLPTHVLFLG